MAERNAQGIGETRTSHSNAENTDDIRIYEAQVKGDIQYSIVPIEPQEITIELEDLADEQPEINITIEELQSPEETLHVQRCKDIDTLMRGLYISAVPHEAYLTSAFGEECSFKYRHNDNVRNIDMDELGLPGRAIRMVTFVAYAKGTNLVHEQDKYGIVAHRDFLVCEDEDGRYIYTDFKTQDYHSIPSQFDIDPDTLQRFTDLTSPPGQPGRIAIERYHGETSWGFDPYRIGLGSTLQALMLAYAIGADITRLRTKLLTIEGKRMYDKFGLDTSKNPVEIDPRKVLPEVHTVLVLNMREW